MWRPFLALISYALLITVLSACGPKQESPHIPTAPDMTEILRDYDAPTAPIDNSTIDSVIESYRELEEYRELVCGPSDCNSGLFCALCPGMTELDQLWNAAFGGGEQGEKAEGLTVERFGTKSGALQVAGTEFAGDGYIHASRSCDGDPDGSMYLTVVLSEEGINPIVWGEVRGCDVEVAGVTARLYVDFRMSLGSDTEQKGLLPEQLNALDSLVLWVNGDLVSEGNTYGLTVDIKALTGESEVQLRIPIEKDHVLFYFKDQFNYGFDALNGRWGCEFPTGFPEILETGKKIICTQTDTGESVSLSL